MGLTHLYSLSGFAFFDCGGVRLFISEGDPRSNSILYFSVDNIHAEHQRLIDAGVEIAAAPHRIHVHDDGREEWMCFFRDPDGGHLALMTIVQPEGEAA